MIWRRLRVIPLLVTIPDEEMDKHLIEKLKKERSGILTWALLGCVEWQRYGLGESEEVQKATAEYQAEMDLVPNFIGDRCLVGPDQQTLSSRLNEAFKAWCEDEGEDSMTKKAFGTRLRELGFTEVVPKN